MKQEFFKLFALGAAVAVLSGCVSTIDGRGGYVQKSMISAADFEAMIDVQVRELEPLPVEQAVASSN